MKILGSGSTPKSISRVLRQILPDLIILPTVALILSAAMTWANVGLGDAFFPGGSEAS